MGPRTGPRPASSTPRTHGTGDGERRESGTGEKCVYVSPATRAVSFIDGGMKTLSGGVSRAMLASSTICASSMLDYQMKY